MYQKCIRKSRETDARAVLSCELTGLSVSQVVTMGLFRTIALFYLGSFDGIVRRCMMQKAKSETTDKTA